MIEYFILAFAIIVLIFVCIDSEIEMSFKESEGEK